MAEKQDPDDDDDDDDDNDDENGEGGGNSGGSKGKTDGGTEDGQELEDQCTEDQIAIAEEYADSVHRIQGDWPCGKFLTPGAEIAGTKGKHGHTVGYLDDAYVTGKERVTAYMEALGYTVWRTSEWRCPQGNKDVKGTTAETSSTGRISPHVRGIAGDLVTPNIDLDVFQDFMEAARAAGATYHYKLNEWNQGKRHMHVQWGT